MTTEIKYNQKEIYSPNRRYVALLHESEKGYVICPVEVWEHNQEHIDTDYQVGWISHTNNDEGFYLHDITVENYKVNLLELYALTQLCCKGCFDNPATLRLI